MSITQLPPFVFKRIFEFCPSSEPFTRVCTLWQENAEYLETESKRFSLAWIAHNPNLDFKTREIAQIALSFDPSESSILPEIFFDLTISVLGTKITTLFKSLS